MAQQLTERPTGLAILGSTGSIGTQALEVVRANKERLAVRVLVARRSAAALIAQAREFLPEVVVVTEDAAYREVREALSDTAVRVLGGSEAICEAVQLPEVDVVLTAMVGFSGLAPTLAAIESGKTIALSNKETLVVAGELIMRLAKERGARIIPVDSEHSAIYQCLVGETTPLERILLTASGGPFRTWSREAIARATRTEALKHPNWVMGAKVTIDSASLMNKGLEMIEARWLFDVEPEQIEVLVHPQSIIHSMVQYRDGSVKAQLGTPDMRLPIGYALGLTERLSNDYPRLDFTQHSFTFERPDLERFPNLGLAYRAIARGGTAPCILNAANEVAVEAFLTDRLGFRAMSDLVSWALDSFSPSDTYSAESLADLDGEVRRGCWTQLDTFTR